MAWTRTQYIGEVRSEIDAVGDATRWSPTTVNLRLGYQFVALWKRILNAQRNYRYNPVAITLDSNGQFAWSALSTGSADAQLNAYRILNLNDGARNFEYEPFDMDPLALSTQAGMNLRPKWQLIGQKVQVIPVTPSLTMTANVNWFPTPIDQLSADSVVPDFPAGYELAIVLKTAFMLLNKAGQESDYGQSLKNEAEEVVQEMCDDLARQDIRPIFPMASDSASDWGASTWGGGL